MAVHGGPDIVTDGLKVCLDAADLNSYPGSGTTWYDLSGNGYNGTMTNGPTFDSDGGGCLSFTAGSTHYVDVTSPPGLKTYSSMCIWFNTGVDSEGLWDLSMADSTGTKNVDENCYNENQSDIATDCHLNNYPNLPIGYNFMRAGSFPYNSCGISPIDDNIYYDESKQGFTPEELKSSGLDNIPPAV